MPYGRVGTPRLNIPLLNPVSMETLPVVVKQFNVVIGTFPAEIFIHSRWICRSKIKVNIYITGSVVSRFFFRFSKNLKLSVLS